MKHLLNTLYVTTQGAYLQKEGETLVVRVENTVRLRVPIHMLGSVVCFGNVMCSPFLLGHCAVKGVCVSMFTENGRFLARVEGPVHGNILLRKEQYRRSEDPIQSAEVAQSVILGKIANSRYVLQRALRDYPDMEAADRLVRGVKHLGSLLMQVRRGGALDTLRGLEGDAGKVYFSVFGELIRSQREDFPFQDRNRRPPMDNLNALLSFVYTLLVHDCRGALEGVGLDPQAGFLHRDRPGRPSLALDLMEELRAPIADRLALSLVNLQQVNSKGFRKQASGAVEMTDDTRKTLLAAYQKRKQDKIKHPFLEEDISIGWLPHVQAMLMARFIRGDLDGYPPYFVK